MEVRVSVPLVKLVEKSSLGKKNLSGAQRENWTYFPRFCIFIINHLLCWPELWKRSSVHYFFKRSFLCFLKVCAPFCFVQKATWPWFVSLTSSGRKIKKRLVRVAVRHEVERDKNVIFNTKQTHVFSPVTWSKAPKVHQLTGGLLFTQDLN